MFNKNCKANNCKNEAKDSMERMYSEDIPSSDMGWTYVKFCSTSCMKAFKKEKSEKRRVTWGNGWD